MNTPEESSSSLSFLGRRRRRRFDLLKKHPLPIPLDDATIVGHNGSVYVIGGGVSGDTFLQFNVTLMKWVEFPCMNEARDGSMAVIWKGFLFVLGGKKNNHGARTLEYLCSVEFFPLDGRTDASWTLAPPEHYLPEGCAYGAAFIVGEGEIVVAGGRGRGDTWLKTCFHHGNASSINANINSGVRTTNSSSKGFTRHPFPPFPGYPSDSMYVVAAPKCLFRVGKDGIPRTLAFQATKPIMAHHFGHTSPEELQQIQRNDLMFPTDNSTPSGKHNPDKKAVDDHEEEKEKKEQDDEYKRLLQPFRRELDWFQAVEKLRIEKQIPSATASTRAHLEIEMKRLESSSAESGLSSSSAIQTRLETLKECLAIETKKGDLYPTVNTLKKEAESVERSINEFLALGVNDEVLLDGLIVARQAIEDRIKNEEQVMVELERERQLMQKQQEQEQDAAIIEKHRQEEAITPQERVQVDQVLSPKQDEEKARKKHEATNRHPKQRQQATEQKQQKQENHLHQADPDGNVIPSLGNVGARVASNDKSNMFVTMEEYNVLVSHVA